MRGKNYNVVAPVKQTEEWNESLLSCRYREAYDNPSYGKCLGNLMTNLGFAQDVWKNIFSQIVVQV